MVGNDEWWRDDSSGVSNPTHYHYTNPPARETILDLCLCWSVDGKLQRWICIVGPIDPNSTWTNRRIATCPCTLLSCWTVNTRRRRQSSFFWNYPIWFKLIFVNQIMGPFIHCYIRLMLHPRQAHIFSRYCGAVIFSIIHISKTRDQFFNLPEYCGGCRIIVFRMRHWIRASNWAASEQLSGEYEEQNQHSAHRGQSCPLAHLSTPALLVPHLSIPVLDRFENTYFSGLNYIADGILTASIPLNTVSIIFTEISYKLGSLRANQSITFSEILNS